MKSEILQKQKHVTVDGDCEVMGSGEVPVKEMPQAGGKVRVAKEVSDSGDLVIVTEVQVLTQMTNRSNGSRR